MAQSVFLSLPRKAPQFGRQSHTSLFDLCRMSMFAFVGQQWISLFQSFSPAHGLELSVWALLLISSYSLVNSYSFNCKIYGGDGAITTIILNDFVGILPWGMPSSVLPLSLLLLMAVFMLPVVTPWKVKTGFETTTPEFKGHCLSDVSQPRNNSHYLLNFKSLWEFIGFCVAFFVYRALEIRICWTGYNSSLRPKAGCDECTTAHNSFLFPMVWLNPAYSSSWRLCHGLFITLSSKSIDITTWYWQLKFYLQFILEYASTAGVAPSGAIHLYDWAMWTVDRATMTLTAVKTHAWVYYHVCLVFSYNINPTLSGCYNSTWVVIDKICTLLLLLSWVCVLYG